MAGRGRPKKNVALNKTLSQYKKNDKYKCVCCGEEKAQDREFYLSNSVLFRANSQRMVICKKCITDLYGMLVTKHENLKYALYILCRMLDVYFDADLYDSVEVQANNSGSNICNIYFQKINSLPQYQGKTFAESTPYQPNATKNIFYKFEPTMAQPPTDEDEQNKEDVIRMVGYDPFEKENPDDKKALYNMLVDFLDESTLEDSFKLPIVIEIVKSFNQIDKINQSLALMTTDIKNIQTNVGGVKGLLETKDKIYRAILAMAKDNGISVNHSTNKSKGSGTLSGLIKKLQEKGFMEIEVNLYDVETCEGIQQVANISNSSIMKQLQFDENDYAEMLSQQRKMIADLDSKNIKLEEEVRLLKVQLQSAGDKHEG